MLLRFQFQVINEVRYESALPWGTAADGGGASLQLVDAAQDNDRVGNWIAVSTNAPPGGPQWRYVVAPGTASSSVLYIYLQSAGEVYLDDIKLVAGSVAESGPNLLLNGDFESGFPGPWGVSTNLTGSGLSSTRHGGASGLRVVASSGGVGRTSSIYQDLTPALVANAPYTLSFWVLENTNGGTLTLRLSNNGILTNVNLLPGAGLPNLARFTPGAPNSVRASLPTLPKLWLNEILPNNLGGATDRFGHRHAWVELYNSGPTNLSLAGMFLANNYSNLLQWPFPPGATIGSGQFRVVWLDGNPAESSATEWHTSFSVPASFGSLALVNVNGGRTNILDYLNYELTQSDRSYGAWPDGSPSRRQVFWYATAGASNNPAAPPLNVLINEWMADNQTTIADPADNDFEDWFELTNPGDTFADLAGFYLGSSLTNRTKFRIPAGYVIPPHGHLVVWADEETGQNSTNYIDLHVNFKLSKAGDAIGLFAPDGAVVDFVSFGSQVVDVSEGRYPDGETSIRLLSQATPRVANLFFMPNTEPTLSAIPERTVFAGQVVTLNAVATDLDLPPQRLTYSLDPGAPATAAINPDTGLFSWRPTNLQAPSTNLITIRVTDEGIPALSTTTNFTVRVAVPPRLTALRPAVSGGYAITFVTVPNKAYCLEYKDSLQDSQWTPLGTSVLATGDFLTITDEVGGTGQRFYRIVALD